VPGRILASEAAVWGATEGDPANWSEHDSIPSRGHGLPTLAWTASPPV
jgi:class 3 adenylate cyclase